MGLLYGILLICGGILSLAVVLMGRIGNIQYSFKYGFIGYIACAVLVVMGILRIIDFSKKLKEKLKSETESVVNPDKVSFNYAGFWRRFAAILIDFIILSIILYSLFLAVNSIIFSLTDNIRATLIIAFVWIKYGLEIVMFWLYFTLFECSKKQSTIGKMIMGIIVTDISGSRISFSRANSRFWGKIISGVILLIGFFMAGFTRKKQALHDMMAGTIVLKR